MSPRVPTQERRNEIMEAAMRCFRRSGYQGTTMDDVVAESGLSKGTIYWHFRNKKQLFLEVFDRLINQIGEGIIQLIGQEDLPPAERLAASLESVVAAFEDELEISTFPLQFLLEMMEDEDFMARYRQLIGAFAGEAQKMIEEGIQSGDFRQVNTEDLAWGLMAAFDGILLYATTGMPGNPLGMGKALTSLIIAGLKSK